MACAARFKPIEGLNTTDFGVFYLRVQEAGGYASSQDHPRRHVPREGKVDIDLRAVASPCVWFLTQDQTGVLQMQSDLFAVNWRKQQEADSYPRYSKLKERFNTEFKRFCDYLVSRELSPPERRQYELTYVNHIDLPMDNDLLAAVKDVFPRFSWLSGGSAERAQSLHWRTTFALPGGQGGALSEQVVSGTHNENGAPVLRYTLTASSDFKEAETGSSDVWFECAHESIVRRFAESTSQTWQSEKWRKTG